MGFLHVKTYFFITLHFTVCYNNFDIIQFLPHIFYCLYLHANTKHYSCSKVERFDLINTQLMNTLANVKMY